MPAQAIKNKPISAAEHKVLRLEQMLRIEREMHDKTIAALAIADGKLRQAELLADALDSAFTDLTGMSPAEYMESENK